jgi:hypothetical protein
VVGRQGRARAGGNLDRYQRSRLRGRTGGRRRLVGYETDLGPLAMRGLISGAVLGDGAVVFMLLSGFLLARSPT